MSYPVYMLFNLWGDSFRTFIIALWMILLLLLLFLLGHRYIRDLNYQDRFLAYGGVLALSAAIFFNICFYEPFSFSRGIQAYDIGVYPEVAAIVFANHIAFAVCCLVTYLIFREVFASEWWGIFGLATLVAGSSYLFWSGNAKDHMLTILFFTIVVYFFILFLKQGSYLHLISSFIAVGWVAWVRPELGLTLAIGLVLLALFFAYRRGFRAALTTLVCSVAILFGALTLLLNNYGLTGHPLTLPWMTVEVDQGLSAMVNTHYTVQKIEIAANLYHIFVNPVFENASGIFQISPLSFFAVLLAVTLGYLLITRTAVHLEPLDRRYIITFAAISAIVIFAYLRSLPGLGISPGINPDIRYLSPLYLPLTGLGLYALKLIDFTERDIITSLKTLGALAVTVLPLAYVIQQYLWPSSLATQLTFLMWLSYSFLAVAAITYLLALSKRLKTEYVAYALPIPLLFSLVWESVVDFRFATVGWEGYHFWIPLVQYVWYMQYHIFPF
ncbi:hypothetical protein [Methanoculleus taiwanensis]|uniref:hypothetical protein n=1 Tax=Methanoculleus taiwanensis TaxID=1550565 RepID=UPI000FFE5F23|nr:hypothetical protein [Methanoculleus taiwanensis]